MIKSYARISQCGASNRHNCDVVLRKAVQVCMSVSKVGGVLDSSDILDESAARSGDVVEVSLGDTFAASTRGPQHSRRLYSLTLEWKYTHTRELSRSATMHQRM